MQNIVNATKEFSAKQWNVPDLNPAKNVFYCSVFHCAGSPCIAVLILKSTLKASKPGTRKFD